VSDFEQSVDINSALCAAMADTVARLRAQAEGCLRLAKACSDIPTRESLTALAADSLERASKLASEPAIGSALLAPK
jgi:hypothetical protein